MSTKSVLIVDDSRVSRMMVSAIINNIHADWTITEAASGDEAITVLSELKPDIAIIDFNMPGIDGLQLAEKIKQQSPDTAITLLTANVQDSIQAKAAKLGVSFAGKPITEEKIVSIIS